MNDFDKTIFSLLQDYQGIEYVKENYPEKDNKCTALYREGMQYLMDKSYSDINVQDEQGNTFLHYALIEVVPVVIKDLLYNGANPYIKNNKGINCYNVNSRQFTINFLHKIIEKEFKNININFFYKKGKNISSEFKNDLFNDNIFNIASEFKESSFSEIQNFLISQNILSNSNLISIIFKTIYFREKQNIPNLKETILEKLLEIKKTPYENSLLAKEILNNLFFIKFTESEKAKMLNFIKNENIEINSNFLLPIINGGLEQNISHLKNKNNLFFNNYIHLVIDRIVKKEMSISENVADKQIENIFSQKNFLHKTYLKIKLEYQLKLNSKVISKKNKI